MTEECDLLIVNGLVIDPDHCINQEPLNIAVADGKILDVFKPDAASYVARETFDACGCYVTPGLIDIHVHCYEHVTALGINADDTCLARGVTTVVDAGSAGCGTFQGLRKFIMEKSHTRVLAFLHISSHGLAAAGCSANASGGELDSLTHVQVDDCVKCVEENSDVIVGIKIRLSESISNRGANEQEAYRRALTAAKRVDTRLMVHHSMSTVPLANSDWNLSCPGDLRMDDIYTHTFHGHESTIADLDENKLHPIVKEARRNGVLFDVGHGQGSFSWKVSEIASKEEFYPDLISTDLHMLSIEGPAYDLVTVMSKFLHLGMSLFKVIEAVTYTPAVKLSWHNQIGSLIPGKIADITVLRLKEGEFVLEDCEGNVRTCKQLLEPTAVWKDGVAFSIKHSTIKGSMSK